MTLLGLEHPHGKSALLGLEHPYGKSALLIFHDSGSISGNSVIKVLQMSETAIASRSEQTLVCLMLLLC
jgi:hypothetical protein